MEPLDFFKNYGSHFVREYILGGRLDFCSSTDVSKRSSKMGVTAQAKMAFDAVVSGLPKNLEHRKSI